MRNEDFTPKTKGFLYRVVTSHKKWIYYKNLKRKEIRVTPEEQSTLNAKPNRFGKMMML